MRASLAVTVALVIPAIFSTGCGGLDVSARAEGTGVQFSGLIRVLHKYKASRNQLAIAESKASRAYVELALKPAYEARTRKLRKQVAGEAGRGHRKPGGGSEGPDATALARAELAVLTDSWKETASRITQGRYTGDFALPDFSRTTPLTINFPKLSETEVLAASAAYVPRYLAVPVPAEQVVSGAKASVMLYDTQLNRLSSDTVYALDRVPSALKPSEIEKMKVQYAVQ